MSAINVDTIRSRTGTAPQLDKGVEVTVGVASTGDGGINVGGAATVAALTATGNISAVDATFRGTLTYDDVTNVDAVGYATFRSGINVQGAGSTTTTLNVSGISTFTGQLNAGTVSATTLIRNGSALTGLPAGFTELDAALFN